MNQNSRQKKYRIQKVFDRNGDVQEDEIILIQKVITFKNVTIFFYEDNTFQIMVDDLPVFCNGK